MNIRQLLQAIKTLSPVDLEEAAIFLSSKEDMTREQCIDALPDGMVGILLGIKTQKDTATQALKNPDASEIRAQLAKQIKAEDSEEDLIDLDYDIDARLRFLSELIDENENESLDWIKELLNDFSDAIAIRRKERLGIFARQQQIEDHSKSEIEKLRNQKAQELYQKNFIDIQNASDKSKQKRKDLSRKIDEIKKAVVCTEEKEKNQVNLSCNNEEGSIFDYPTEIIDAPDAQFTLGDLHGNPIKLVQFLIKHSIIEMDDVAYKRLIAIYQDSEKWNSLLKSQNQEEEKEKIKKQINEYNEIISNLKIKNKSFVRLIGDVLADRGNNDYLTLKVLEKLGKENVPVSILFSNHDADFVSYYEQFMSECKPVCLKHAPSLYGLDALVQAGLVEKEEIESIVSPYYNASLRFLDYTLSNDKKEITLYSHAGVGITLIKSLARKLDVNFNDESAESLANTIDDINHQLQLHALKGTISTLYTRDDMQAAYRGNPLNVETQPVAFLLWNREYQDLDRPHVHNGYKINYVHGHDSDDDVSLDHVKDVDNAYAKFMANPKENPFVETGNQYWDGKKNAIVQNPVVTSYGTSVAPQYGKNCELAIEARKLNKTMNEAQQQIICINKEIKIKLDDLEKSAKKQREQISENEGRKELEALEKLAFLKNAVPINSSINQLKKTCSEFQDYLTEVITRKLQEQDGGDSYNIPALAEAVNNGQEFSDIQLDHATIVLLKKYHAVAKVQEKLSEKNVASEVKLTNATKRLAKSKDLFNENRDSKTDIFLKVVASIVAIPMTLGIAIPYIWAKRKDEGMARELGCKNQIVTLDNVLEVVRLKKDIDEEPKENTRAISEDTTMILDDYDEVPEDDKKLTKLQQSCNDYKGYLEKAITKDLREKDKKSTDQTKYDINAISRLVNDNVKCPGLGHSTTVLLKKYHAINKVDEKIQNTGISTQEKLAYAQKRLIKSRDILNTNRDTKTDIFLKIVASIFAIPLTLGIAIPSIWAKRKDEKMAGNIESILTSPGIKK